MIHKLLVQNLHFDDQGAINCGKSSEGPSARDIRIGVSLHHIRELRQGGVIDMDYVSIKEDDAHFIY